MEFRLSLDDFDKSLLPVDRTMLEADADLFRKAVEGFFVERLKQLGGQARIVIDDTSREILIHWSPVDSRSIGAFRDYALSLLTSGRIDEAVPFLEMLLSHDPTDQMGLYNLGMILSDKGQLDRALGYLNQLVELDPRFANGWIALGVARGRTGDVAGARPAFEKAIEFEPNNGFACRNFAGILMKSGDHARAKEYFEKAQSLLPKDPATLLGLGQCLFEMGDLAAADALLVEVLDAVQTGGISETARTLRSQIAARNFRSAGVPRMDAVMFCLAAIEKFEGRPTAEIKQVTFEIAMLGRRGLDINSSAAKYTLRSMPGKFSGLHLMAYMYVGFKILDPATDMDFDLRKEYEAAMALHQQRRNRNGSGS